MILAREKPGEETCVCCGREIPEGRQTCAYCEAAWNRRDNKKYKKTKGGKMAVRIMDFLRQWGDVGAILLCAILLIACMCIAAASAMDGAAKEDEHPPERAERTMEPPPMLTAAECEMIRNAAARYECGEGILDRFAEPQEPPQTEWIAVPALGWGATPLELEMVARIVWLEARGESETTQRCVAEVIFNRLRSGLWGDCLTDVLWAENDSGAPEFETVDDMWTAEVDDGIMEMVKSVFSGGCRIPKRIMWFRADRYHAWDGAVDEFVSDHTYFSSSTWVTGGQGADGTT